MKAAGCDLVVLGTIIRETIGTIGESRKSRLQPDLPRLQRGLHRPHPQARRQGDGRPLRDHDGAEPVPRRANSQPIRFWANKYKTKFNEDPTVFSVYGYNDHRPVRAAAAKAGPNLTTDSFIKAMDIDDSSPTCSAPPSKLHRDQAPGQRPSRLSQIQDGKWKSVSEYLTN